MNFHPYEKGDGISFSHAEERGGGTTGFGVVFTQ